MSGTRCGETGDKPYFGICGKLGESKGSFALLDTMHQLKEFGLDVGLVALAHGHTADEKIASATVSANWVLRTAFCKSRFSRIGVYPNSCVAALPSAASSRTFPSGFTVQSSRSKCCFAEPVW